MFGPSDLPSFFHVDSTKDGIPNPKTRRTVENAITRGLWDQMDDIQPVVEELEIEMEDYNATCTHEMWMSVADVKMQFPFLVSNKSQKLHGYIKIM